MLIYSERSLPVKYHPLNCAEADKTVLDSDRAGAREIGSVQLGKLYFYFRVRTRLYYLPYTQITRCFRRVELVPAKMCCGKGDFEIENIVICGENDEEIAQIQLPGAKAGKILLEEIARLAPHCIIGKKSAGEDA